MGFNYRMTDIQAAVGRVQLKRLPQLLAERRALAGQYADALRDVRGLQPPCIPAYARPNFQSYPVRVSAEYPLSRDALMQKLLDEGISTRRGIMNAHQEKAYSADLCAALPESERARDTAVLLPLYAGLTAAEVERVVTALAVAEVSARRPRASFLSTPVAQGHETNYVT